MAISSLPGGSIGSLGQAAYDFVDFLAAAGQSWWQLLPVGPTGYGDSPYQSFSTFAANPYFVDLGLLHEAGLLSTEEVAQANPPGGRFVEYGQLFDGRFDTLAKASARGLERMEPEYAAFKAENADWLEDYALFMALKRYFGMVPWVQWPGEIRLRDPEALRGYAALLQAQTEIFSYTQYLFFKQWAALRAYAAQNGVKLMGDLPIYVAMDSADVWAHPENFLLDEDGFPLEVAGVPPDYFSETGQLWGNPLYRWEHMRETGYAWWMQRAGAALRLYDAVRIDHFRGFDTYWAVPFGEATAANGVWREGPGLAFIDKLRVEYPDGDIIAEDLGDLSESARALLEDSGFPGMKVLQFAFAPSAQSVYLPHNIGENCVCYSGTHDNDTLAGWLCGEGPDVAFAHEYLGLNTDEDESWGVLRGGAGTRARLFIAPMQDYLGLGSESRMNVPGTAQGNWRWRLAEGECTATLARRIRRLAQVYGRATAE